MKYKANLEELLTKAYKTKEPILPEVRIRKDGRFAVFYVGGMKQAHHKLSQLGRAFLKKGGAAEGFFVPSDEMTVDMARRMLEDGSIFDR